MPNDAGKLLAIVLVGALVLIVAVLIFSTLNQSPIITSLPNSSKEQVQGIQDTFWATVAIIGVGGTIGVLVLLAKKFG